VSEADARDRARARVETLVRAARRIADPDDELGVLARATLPDATGLSPAGVVLALEHHLETSPSAAEIESLIASVRPARSAHVVLSASVFVAAHRAIALGLASSETVHVRPSRREGQMARLLARAAPGSFDLVEAIEAKPGDVVFAYGADESLAAIEAGLSPSVVFRGHGSGMGVAFVDVSSSTESEIEEACGLLCDDVVPFDQRGCLSPRIALVAGAVRKVEQFGEALAATLAVREAKIPRGRILADEAAEAARYRDTMRFAATVHAAGSAWVGVDPCGELSVVPPPGRNVHVARTSDVGASVSPIGHWITVAGIFGADSFASRVREALPRARKCRLGAMQRPPFDGPADLRDSSAGAHRADPAGL
jgi:acyl-CoA reductase LuxC